MTYFWNEVNAWSRWEKWPRIWNVKERWIVTWFVHFDFRYQNTSSKLLHASRFSSTRKWSSTPSGTYTSTRAATFMLHCIMSPVAKLSFSYHITKGKNGYLKMRVCERPLLFMGVVNHGKASKVIQRSKIMIPYAERRWWIPLSQHICKKVYGACLPSFRGLRWRQHK